MSVISAAVSTHKALTSLSSALRGGASAAQHLSTGQAINSAADNALTFSMSNRMAAQIRGLAVANQNIQDGISLLDTAETAMEDLTTITQRMREMTILASNGTLNESDRSALDKEFQQLKKEMGAIVADTRYNDIPLLNPRGMVMHESTPARISGAGPVNVTSPASGTYTLFINGEAVAISLQQNESASARLNRIANTINQSFSVHGAVATPNAEGGLDLYTPDGRDLSAWFDSSISGLSAASFGLSTSGVAQVSNISLEEQITAYPTSFKGPDYLEFAGYGGSSENIGFSQTSSPSSVNGIFSVVNNVVYRGDGLVASVIGSIDPVKNGANGQPLRINFKPSFTNGGFEDSSVGSGSIPGWTVLNERIKLNGGSTIASFPTPSDTSAAPMGSGETSSVSAGVSYQTQITNTTASQGSQSLMMSSSGMTIDSYGVAHGPAIVSESPVYIKAADTISFDWKAQNGADNFDVYAYLLNADTGQTIELLNQTGSVTNWATKSVTVPATGNYKFVFISGTFDASGGRAAGAQLYIDNIVVSSQSQAFNPSASDIASFKALTTYNDSTPFTVSATINGISVTSAASIDRNSALDSLATQIATKLSNGSLRNIQVARSPSGLNLTSTLAGTPFTITQTTTSSSYRTLSTQTLTANQAPQDAIDGIANATTSSTGATVHSGTGTASTSLTFSQNLTIQAGANEGDTITLRLLDYGALDGDLDELLWDMNPREYAQAQIAAQASGSAWVSSSGLPIVKIDSLASANSARETLDRALNRLMADRADLGSQINRLTSAKSHSGGSQFVMSLSKSRMVDADYAQESSELAKWLIIQQTSTAILTQANASARTVLQLLK